jgi:tetratricopeptide (TPR) repeat protein
VSFSAALASASLRAADPGVLSELARMALEEGEEERALPLIEAGLARRPTARLWQWKGLLERALDRHADAMSALNEAARLDPDDASIAHGRARIALEAGLPAEDLYERALTLDPDNGGLLIGRASARFAAGHGDQARLELEAVLQRAPLWIEGHVQLSQLRSMLGRSNEIGESLEQALSTMPDRPELWRALLDLDVRKEDFENLARTVESARSIAGAGAWLLPYDAIAAAELGMTDRADEHFHQLERGRGPQLPIWRIRHALRTQRVEEAMRLIDAELASDRSADAWPYASLAPRREKRISRPIGARGNADGRTAAQPSRTGNSNPSRSDRRSRRNLCRTAARG